MKEIAPLSHTGLLPQKITPQRQGVKADQLYTEKQTRESPKMRRQRKQTQSEGKEESPERLLNKIEVTKLSDIEFKIMLLRMLKELSENFRKLQGSFKELTVNYTSMKKYMEKHSGRN